jgi:hypothetical protein
MPYFQRGRLTDGAPPVKGAAGTERLTGDIVEKAAAILEQETRASAVPTAGGMSAPLALPPLALPALALPNGGKGPADIQKQLSQALAALLNAFLQSVPISELAPRAPTAAHPSLAGATVPLVSSESPTKAGETAKVDVTVAKDGPGEASLTLYSTDFVSDTGFQIPSACATFSPRSVTVDGGESKKSEMRIAIPAQCGRGAYSALVQAMGVGRPCAVVVLQVE